MVSTFLIIGVFVGLWAGTGALVASRTSSMVRLAGSVPQGAGYMYTVRPATHCVDSDSTRSFGYPRPLINSLNAELDGSELQ